MDKFKSMAGRGISGAWRLENTVQKGVDYAKKNPGKAAKKVAKGAAKGVGDTVVTVGKTAGGIVKGVVIEPTPYVLKQSFKGLKATGKSIANSFKAMDHRKLDVTGESPKADKARGFLDIQRAEVGGPETARVDQATVDELHKGLVAAMRLDIVIRANPALLKVDKSEVAKHLGAEVTAKFGKLTLSTFLFTHVPFLQHTVMAHYLADPKVLGWLGIHSGAAEVANGTAAVTVADRHLSKTLHKSFAWEVYNEKSKRRRTEKGQISHLDAMGEAMEALVTLRDAYNGDPDAQKDAKRKDVFEVEQGLKVARALADMVQTPAFAHMVGDVTLDAAEAHAHGVMAKFGLQASEDCKLPSFEPPLTPPAPEEGSRPASPAPGDATARAVPTPHNAAAALAADENRNSVVNRLFSKRYAKWRDNRDDKKLDKAAQAADARATKYAGKLAEVQQELDGEVGHNVRRLFDGKGAKINLGARSDASEFQIRKNLAEAHAQMARMLLDKVPESHPARQENLKLVIQLEKELGAQQAVSSAIPQALDTPSWWVLKKGYEGTMEAARGAMETHSKTLNQIDREIAHWSQEANHDEDQVWRLQLSMAKRHRAKVESKKDIARLYFEMAQSELQLGELIRHADPGSITYGALENRLAFNDKAVKLMQKVDEYNRNLDQSKGTSAWVQAGQRPLSAKAPEFAQSMVKFAWWSRSMFPLTALPDWGIRYGRGVWQDHEYLNYMKAMLDKEPIA